MRFTFWFQGMLEGGQVCWTLALARLNILVWGIETSFQWQKNTYSSLIIELPGLCMCLLNFSSVVEARIFHPKIKTPISNAFRNGVDDK